MSYLLDTNVLSELRKPVRKSNPGVTSWVADHNPSEMHISVITIFEIELCIRQVKRRDPHQAELLENWLEQAVLPSFAGRILAVDIPIARLAAQLHVPDPRPERDTLIGATARVNQLSIVTRNIRDFSPLGVDLINPWTEVH